MNDHHSNAWGANGDAGGWRGPIIDSDVHIAVPSIDALTPYLDPYWARFVEETAYPGPPGLGTLYPPHAATTRSPQWVQPDERPGASDLELLRANVLDALGVDAAVLNCYWAVDTVRDPDFAPALVRALNDWIVAEWLERDARLKASLVVPAHYPELAAREIDRAGAHPGFVQVLLPVRAFRPYGNRIWYPMFAVMERHGLTAGLHVGGAPDGAATPCGVPSYFIEEHTTLPAVFAAQLVSLVAEGTFERFPSIKVSLLEAGFSWLPSLVWRMDKEWKGLRRSIPWSKQLPSATIRERVRISTQPLDAGTPDQLARIVEWLGSDDLLMFATDYPHDHGQNASLLLRSLPDTVKQRVMAENARELYGL